MVARPVWTDIAANLFRDYNVIGNPGSGIFLPPKAGHRTYFGEMEGFLGDLYDKAPNILGSVGGTANAATASATPAVDALAAGQVYLYTPTATNTTTGPTLAINGLAALTLADIDGNNLPPGGAIAGRSMILFHDGTKLRNIASRDVMLFKALDADDTGQNINTVQPWFPTAGALTLPIGAWFFNGTLWLSRSAGITSHTTSLQWGGTATYSILWEALINTTDVLTIATPAVASAAVATAIQIKAASVSATEQILVRVTGYLKVTVAGTFIPQFIYSVAPGGAPSVKVGSRFALLPRPGGLASVGAWA